MDQSRQLAVAPVVLCYIAAIPAAVYNGRCLQNAPSRGAAGVANCWNIVIEEPLRVENGIACLDGVVGTGVAWHEEAASRCAA